MNKRKSIIKLSFIIGALIIALVFTFLQIDGRRPYMGLTGTIEKNMGAESQGGVVLVYKAEQPETRSKVSYSKQLEARLYMVRVAISEGNSNSSVISNYQKEIRRQGSNKIRIESAMTSSTEAISKYAENNAQIVFIDANGVEIELGNVIQNVRIVVRMNTNVIEVEVNEEGKKSLEQSYSGTISIIDKAAKDAGKEESVYKIADIPSDAFKDGKLTGSKFTLSDSDSSALQNKYLKLLSGSRPLRLTLISADTISNVRAHNNALMAMGAGLAAAVLLIALLVIRYKVLGIAAAVSLLSCFVLLLFFAAVLPFSTLSYLGLAMITLIMFLNAGAYILAFENIREEYKKGKSVQAAIASGFKKAFWPVFDIHLFAVIAGIGLWILGEGAAASAGMIVLFAAILSMAAATVVCRYLISLTVSIFGEETDPAMMSLKRPAGFKATDIIADEIAKAEKHIVEDDE